MNLNAALIATEQGYQLTLTVPLDGDDDLAVLKGSLFDCAEQGVLIATTLKMVSAQYPPGHVILQRNGSETWLPALPPPPAPAPEPAPEPAVEPTPEPAPEPSPVILHVQSMFDGAEKEPEADPVLHAAIHRRAPDMTHALAAAITQATPPRERAHLVSAMGNTAREVYDWLVARPGQEFTIGEIGRGTRHSDQVVATRVRDLEGAGLVVRKQRKATRGKHPSWQVYSAVVESPQPVG